MRGAAQPHEFVAAPTLTLPRKRGRDHRASSVFDIRRSSPCAIALTFWLSATRTARTRRHAGPASDRRRLALLDRRGCVARHQLDAVRLEPVLQQSNLPELGMALGRQVALGVGQQAVHILTLE